MTKFETIGVQFQQEALSKEDANRSFHYSCNCCCNRGMKIDCDRCAIRFAHETTIAILDDQEQAKKNGGRKQFNNGKKQHNCTDIAERR